MEAFDEGVLKAHGGEEPETASARASVALAENLRDAGVDFARCWFPWRYFEPTAVPGDSLDRLLDEGYGAWPMDSLVNALTAAGVGLVPVLACGYQRMLPDGLSPSGDPTGYIRRASVHARALVRHYKGQVRFWQIENEPNWWEMHEAAAWRTGGAWLEGETFRDELLQALNTSVHEEDPGARTVINLEGDAPRLDAGSYEKWCDLLGLDFYPNYRRPDPVDAAELGRAAEVSKATGRSVVIAETGYPSGPVLLGYSEEKQAQYVRSALGRARATEGVSGIGLWRYVDGPWKSFPDQENHFGLIDSRGRMKPAWRALAETVKELRR